jgi:hypothetical protein
MSLGATDGTLSHRDVCPVHNYALKELDSKSRARDQIITESKIAIERIIRLILGDGVDLGIAANLNNTKKETNELNYRIEKLQDSFDSGKNWIIGILISGFSLVCGTLGTGLWMILSKKLVIAGLN